jgi:REP element-mobilizing transposase RayT
MPRYRRQIAPGSLQHVISRFINREFRFEADGARDEYLRRTARALGRTDWCALAFALMGSHVHWALRAGSRPSAAFVKPLHTGFAGWLNATQRRIGPVFADRHRSITCEGDTAAALVAYIHNNPVRAGVVSDPADSAWTSHRAYLGLATPPAWLDVELGLHLCGFAATPSGRQAFHSFVLSRVGQPRSPELSGGNLAQRRKDARARTASPVEIAAPSVLQRHESVEVHTPLVAPEGCLIRQHWRGTPDAILNAAAHAAGTNLSQLCARGRTREVVAARRLALLTWSRYLNRPVVHMARALGIAESSAAELIATAPRSLHEQASALAHALCAT